VGGGCRNEFLNQFTANATGLPVVAGPEEATALGNIAVQAMGIGIFRDLGSALSSMLSTFGIRNYTPSQNRVWSRHYKRFTGLT